MPYSKTLLITLLLIALSPCLHAQTTWTPEQLQAANTADTVSGLSSTEKDIIKYLNLVRLYPKEFVQIELKSYPASDQNAKSLIRTLNASRSLPPVTFNRQLQQSAECMVNEQGPTGHVGHRRVDCQSTYMGECISYAMESGRDIILQLLLDYDLPDLGHRKICLMARWKSVGVAEGFHKKHSTMAVIDFE